MKKHNSYEIDHISKVIYVTKAFAKEAGILNTTEYQTLLAARRDNPTYDIVIREIAKNAAKQSYRNLTVRNMEVFIENSMESTRSLEDRKAEFNSVKALSKAQASPYAYIKKWFLRVYGDEYKKYQKESATAEAAQ